MKNKLKETKAITLIALVITIIILVLLAGISISALTNQGLFGKALSAKKEEKRARVVEWLNLKLIEEQIGNPGESAEKIIPETRKNVNANINELERIGKEIIVEETSTEEDGENVDIYFYVQVDEDVYKVEMAGTKFIGEAGKFPPIIKMESITDTTNSITVSVITKRNEGGEIEYYIKKDGEENYTLKETTTETKYTFTGLAQEEKYNIKIIAIAENGLKAEVTVDKTLGSVPEGEGKITFGEITWTEGKASVTISSIEKGYTLQYQINNTLENGWTNGESVTGLNHGDKIYARLSDGRNGGTTVEKEILDTVNPNATINLSSTNVTTKETVTATVTHADNQSGVKIENCKWVYNTISTEIGTDESSYPGTFNSNSQQITLSTTTTGTYYLHVLTTDNAGRKKETISEAVNVKENAIVSPETTHTEVSLTYTWDELAEMAKLISNNSEITNDTLEVKVTLNGETKTLGVGDTTTVDGKKVRILGFNHDTLTNSTAYGTATATGKAGISFEYVNFIDVFVVGYEVTCTMTAGPRRK